jgi:Ca2+-binding RTX toxin-like protein
MTILTVGPTSTFPTIAAAMAAANAADTILLEAGYSNETATVTHSGMTVSGQASSTGISLHLGTGISSFSLAGTAPINVDDASDGNTIVGNDGDNTIIVTSGVDAVAGGLGVDLLRVDYQTATGAITGNSTSNFTEAGGSGRAVTITDGTFENFTVLTGSGADTLTVGDGDNTIKTGNGANTVTAGQGTNRITGGDDADTITAGDGGNTIDGGDGANTLTSGAGNDRINSGIGADTIVAGAGSDQVTVHGGADTVDSGAGSDRLVVDYSALGTDVIGGVTSGNLLSGYSGHIADNTVHSVDFVATEAFTVTTGAGNDKITTGGASDRLTGGAGNDSLDAGDGNDILSGGDDQDTLRGAGGTDQLNGGDGNDKLLGGAGSDALDGGAGVDRAQYTYATAGLLADLQVSSVNTGEASGDTYVSVEDLIGSSFADNLRGDAGNNSIWGGNGDDSLFGRLGNDELIGGSGNDRLAGGGGNDTFVFASAFSATTNLDTVADFSVSDDTMQLGSNVFTTLPLGSLAADAFFIGTAAQDAEDRIIYNSASGALMYDKDGTGSSAATEFATLSGGLALTSNNFTVV